MIELLCGMAGSLIVFAGFFAGYWLGNRQPKAVKSEEKEEKTAQLTMEEQLSNMMNYRGE